jgi:hypothetical protein
MRKVPVPSGFPCFIVPVTRAVVEPAVSCIDWSEAEAGVPSIWKSKFLSGCATPGTVPDRPRPRTVQRTSGGAGGLSSKMARHSRLPDCHMGASGTSPLSRDAGAWTKKTPCVAPPGRVEPRASSVRLTPSPAPSAWAVKV